jgi:hypothetical protein
MATFGVETKDGTQVVINHPCLAWVGQVPIAGALDSRAYYFISPKSSLEFDNTEDVTLYHKSLCESFLSRDYGMKFELFLKGEEGCLNDWGTVPHIRIWIDDNLPAMDYYRCLKLAMKTATYNVSLFRTLIGFLKEGANLQEALVLSKVTGHFGYQWPSIYVTVAAKESFVEFLSTGKMQDLTHFRTERSLGDQSKPFNECEEFGSSIPDAPYGWPIVSYQGDLVTDKTVKSIRKTFNYQPRG